VDIASSSSIIGSLALQVVEVRRYGNNGTGNGTSEVSLSSFLHLKKTHSHRGSLRGCNARLVENFEGKVLGVGLNLSIFTTKASETL